MEKQTVTRVIEAARAVLDAYRMAEHEPPDGAEERLDEEMSRLAEALADLPNEKDDDR